MRIRVLGSSSKGNCYILENEEECLVIEAGIPFKEVKKALDFDISKISCVITSHSHNDHSKYLDEYRKAGIPIFAPWRIGQKPLSFKNSKFIISSFDLIHDVPCYGCPTAHCGRCEKHFVVGAFTFPTVRFGR